MTIAIILLASIILGFYLLFKDSFEYPRHKRQSRFLPIFFSCLPALILLAVMIDMHGYGSDYAEGTRTGYVAKTTYKGGMFKSYEGLMLASATPVQYTQDLPVWRFSSLDPEMMKRVDASEGHFVRIHYRQWVVHPITIDTAYEVTGVDIIQ